MKHLSIACITGIMLIGTGTALAEKPSWAGEGKPTQAQIESHKQKMKQKHDSAAKEQSDHTKDQPKMKAAKDKADKQKQQKAHMMEGEHASEMSSEMSMHALDADVAEDQNAEFKPKDKHAEAMARQADKKADAMVASSDKKEQPETSRKWWQFWR